MSLNPTQFLYHMPNHPENMTFWKWCSVAIEKSYNAVQPFRRPAQSLKSIHFNQPLHTSYV